MNVLVAVRQGDGALLIQVGPDKAIVRYEGGDSPEIPLQAALSRGYWNLVPSYTKGNPGNTRF